MTDLINEPPHYLAHPSGLEQIQVTEHMNFCLGNAVKYIWRAGLKGDAVEDLRKAGWYIEREIARLLADRALMAADLERDAAAASESPGATVIGVLAGHDFEAPMRTFVVHDPDGSSHEVGKLPPVERWHE